MSEPTRVLSEDAVTPSTPPSSEVDAADAAWMRPGPDDGGIATLPPLEEPHAELALSPATGEPRRDPLMCVGMGLLYAAALAAAIAFSKAWWDTIHVQNWPNSIHMLRWANARAGSWQSVLLALALGLIGLVMVATPSIAAYAAWQGRRSSRWVGVAAIATSCLAALLNSLAWLALPLAVVGTALLFLPAVGRYFSRWDAFRHVDPVVEHETPPGSVQYGPLPRYR